MGELPVITTAGGLFQLNQNSVFSTWQYVRPTKEVWSWPKLPVVITGISPIFQIPTCAC
jgi:hypothetical protein